MEGIGIYLIILPVIAMITFMESIDGCVRTSKEDEDEDCQAGVKDICFIVDSSGSIRGQNPYDGSFDNWVDGILGYVEDIIWRLDIGTDKARVSLINFSSFAQVEFHLNEYTSKLDLIEHVRNIYYTGGSTNTADAIREMTNNIFSSQNGDRSDVDNIGIIITDGQSHDDIDTAINDALASGIKMFAIGITANIDESTLQKLSSPPHEINKNYWINPNFTNLEATVNSVASETCGTQPPPDPGCDGKILEFSDRVGHIRSPGYLSPYPHGAKCKYLIHGKPDTALTLKYTFMAIEETDCNDNVTIYNGTSESVNNRISIHCQLTTPSEVIVTTGQSALVVFQSDSEYTSLGFELIYSLEFTITPRDEWGARPPEQTTGLTTPLSHVVIHHTAASVHACTTMSSCAEKVRSIQNFHMDDRKWDDIGYNFIVGEDGNAYEGRGWKNKGAHATDCNSKSYGISVLGNFTSHQPNNNALVAIEEVIQIGIDKGYITSNYTIHGHKEVKTATTECPGEGLYAWVDNRINHGAELDCN